MSNGSQDMVIFFLCILSNFSVYKVDGMQTMKILEGTIGV